MTHHPFNPDNPRVRVVRREVASLLLDLWKGALKPSKPTLPAVVDWRWGDATFPAENIDWEWGDDGLFLLLRGHRWESNETFVRNCRVTSEAASFGLSDGSTLTARFAGYEGSSSRLDEQGASRVHRVGLDCWTWEGSGSRPFFWVAPVAHLTVRDGTLTTSLSNGQFNARHLALRGTHLFYAVVQEGGRWWLVFEDRGTPLDRRMIGTDIRALEFAAGQTLDVDNLLGLDEHGVVVGAADLGYPRRGQRRGQPPVPRETFEDRGIWAPVLVNRVAVALAGEHRDDEPVTLGTAAYLESVADTNIHVQYLVAQVALEALANRLVKTPPPLVANTGDWQAFIAGIEGQVRSLSRDEHSANVLLSKLNHSVWNAASGDVVVRAFEHLGIRLGSEEIVEIPRRNVSAHSFVMYKKGDPEAQELADRIAIVRCLLVALIARAVGYTGPIEGWQWEKRAKLAPPWWPVTDDEEAHVHYLATDDESVYADDGEEAPKNPGSS